MMPSYTEPRNLNRERTAIIHDQLEIPVITVGNITTMEMAEDILASGDADVVAMARSYLADPEFIKKAYRGEPELIRPCLRCIECAARPGFGGGVRCSVNPQCGRETKYGTLPPIETKKKVMVVGGGPAGMQAAQIASKRGHDVTIYEKSDKLGGRLWEASVLFKKEDTHRKYLWWDIAETERLGVKVRLNTEVTPEFAAAEAPDVIINASGGVHITPPIPGIDGEQVVSVTDADLGRVELGEKVVVMGGGISGLECAIQLAHDGHQVTLIDSLLMDNLWREVMNELRSGLIEQMEWHNVTLVDGATITALEPGVLHYVKADGAGEGGTIEGTLAADSFVASFGITRDKAFNQAIREVIPEVHVVGDAREPNNIFWANMDGFNVAVEL
jgi:NADPH-dependent 2,4-dienoyl-CoA reductase/sulfur reductase-like enzyme